MTPSAVDAPLLDLPPVVLPAREGPAEELSVPPSRVYVSLALLAGAVLVPVVVVAVLVALEVWLYHRAPAAAPLAIVPVAVAFALVRGLVAALQRPPEPLGALPVPRNEEPELYAEVERLAEAAGTRAPDRILFSGQVNAAVREDGALFGLLSGPRTMTIGAPLLEVLDVSELRAVLAHELGHFAGGDTRVRGLSYRTAVIVDHLSWSLGRRGGAVFDWYARFGARMTASVRQAQEVVADQVSVRVAGRQAAADALRNVDVAARALDAFESDYLAPLVEAGARPEDGLEDWREFLLEPGRAEQLAVEADRDGTPLDPFGGHLSTAERIRCMAGAPDDGGVERDARSAACLVRDPDRWTKRASERWLALAGVHPGAPTVGRHRWHEVVHGSRRALAAGSAGVAA